MEKEFAEYLLGKTIADYNLIAREFSSKRERLWDEIKFLFDGYLAPGQKVLDLGCGNGRYFPLFRERGVDYVGADNSRELVDIAKSRYPGGDFRTGNALDLDFPENHFDAIYSIAVLHHIPSEEFRLKFLKEAKRVLKPGGLLVLTVWNFHQPKERYLLLKYKILKLIGRSKLDWNDILEPWGKKVERYYHSFSKGELAGLAEKTGFKIEDIGLVKNEKGNRRNIYIAVKKPS